MVTLYESIIKNSNIGKYAKLTVEYLISTNEYIRHTHSQYGRMFIFKTENTISHILHVDNNDIIYVSIKIPNKKHRIEKIVSNIAELDIIKEWWKAVDAADRIKQKEILQKIQKELKDYK